MGREESSRREISDTYAEYVVSAMRWPASTGRIVAALLLSPVPMSQAQLRQQLGLSEGSVSEGLRLLTEVGFVERAGDPRARPAFFQVGADSWSWPVTTTQANVEVTYDLALRVLRHLEDFGGGGSALELARRSAAMYEVLVTELPAVLERALAAGDAAVERDVPRAG